jgi:hypothetical protein
MRPLCKAVLAYHVTRSFLALFWLTLTAPTVYCLVLRRPRTGIVLTAVPRSDYYF